MECVYFFVVTDVYYTIGAVSIYYSSGTTNPPDRCVYLENVRVMPKARDKSNESVQFYCTLSVIVEKLRFLLLIEEGIGEGNTPSE